MILQTINKEKWKIAPRAIFEITTIIPDNGCVVNCVFCPQGILKNVYTGENLLSFNNFKIALEKIPKEISLSFAGFSEPWLNKDCTNMLLYAHDKGYNMSVFTTGVGMTIEDIDRIKHIPFSYRSTYFMNENERYLVGDGGFILHIPDNERYAKHPIVENYIKVLEHIKEVSDSIFNFQVVCMGTIHEKIKSIFSYADLQILHSRANNLLLEEKYKPELTQLRHLYTSTTFKDIPMTCGVSEKLYHTVMLPNGDLTLCCMDWGLKHILGNIFKQEYNDIIPEHNIPFELCQNCLYGLPY